MHKSVWMLLILILSGCSTMSLEQCVAINWHGLGYQDGKAGLAQYIGRHGRDCKSYGIQPQYQLYDDGYHEGLSVYCSPGRGFTEGQAGRSYNHVCPDALEPAFLAEYQKGLSLYQVEQERLRKQR